MISAAIVPIAEVERAPGGPELCAVGDTSAMSEFKGDPDFPVLLLRRQVAFPRVVVRVLVGRKRSLALPKHLQKAVCYRATTPSPADPENG